MQTQIKYRNQRLVNLPRVLDSYLAPLNYRVEMIAACIYKEGTHTRGRKGLFGKA